MMSYGELWIISNWIRKDLEKLINNGRCFSGIDF